MLAQSGDAPRPEPATAAALCLVRCFTVKQVPTQKLAAPKTREAHPHNLLENSARCVQMLMTRLRVEGRCSLDMALSIGYVSMQARASPSPGVAGRGQEVRDQPGMPAPVVSP